MNAELDRLARSAGLDDPAQEHLRLAFGYACVRRVEHFLEEPAVVACLSGLGRYLAGTIDRPALGALAREAAELANRHRGSASIDGCGHAAVSATYAVAQALSGKALQAAEYAAYAAVYGQGGYGAVNDPDSFTPEFRWQVDRLAALISAAPA